MENHIKVCHRCGTETFFLVFCPYCWDELPLGIRHSWYAIPRRTRVMSNPDFAAVYRRCLDFFLDKDAGAGSTPIK